MSAPVPLGAGRDVSLDRVESELRRLWQDAEDDDAGLIRACVLNLVILRESAGGPGESGLSDLLAAVTAEHPCRVLQVRADPEAAESRIDAFVSAFCHRAGPRSRQVCCEQISLSATGAAARHLHAALAALLVPDLPVFVWWRGVPPWGSHRLDELAALADRLLVDSSEGAEPVATLAALAEWARTAGDTAAAAGDLAWRRASCWREATAALFDPPALRGRLGQVTDVAIRHGGGPQRPDRPQALYLAGWLAGRLGWQVRPATARPTGDRMEVELDAGSHVVRLTLAPAGGPEVLRLTCGAGRAGEATAAVEQADPDRIAAAWRSGSGGAWPRSMSLPASGPAALLGRELEFPRAEAVYGEALPVAGELARLWQTALAP